ncbi:MAG: PAS domain S-box protein [Actinobacteria bacterium]|nr:MAG: PAS domain S-box protein [Actinomycetota bacterium]
MSPGRPMLEPMKAKLTVPGRSLPARVFDQSSLGILLAHLDGLILEANDAFLFLVDRGRDEVVGHTIGELGFFSSMGEDRAKDLLRERGAIDGFDAHVLTPSGEARVLRLWAEAIADGDDRIVVVRASDDAGRVAAGARYYELREAEVRYRALVEQIPAITYTEIEDETSPIGYRDVYISPQCEHILGYTPFEWQADPELWIRAMHPDDRDRVVRDDRASLETGTFTSEYRMLARDGRVVWFQDEANVVEDPVSGVRFWHGVMLDVTELKLAEANHSELAAKYRTLVEQIPAVVYLAEYGEQGDWLYISPQLERVLGYTPEEWLAHPHPMASFTHPDDIAVVREAEERSLSLGEPFRAEYRMQTKDGGWLWILDEATAVRDQNERPFVLQGVMYDISERKRSEQELKEVLEKLRAMDRLKNTLLHTLSHDLQNPLTAIHGAASTLERLDSQLSTEERSSLLKSLAGRTQSLRTLLTDLLDLDRLDRGIVEPRRSLVDLPAMIRRLVASSEALTGRLVEIETEPVTIAVDQPKVERMVENLLANVARHTEDARVWIRVAPQDGGALISVDDEGAGVPDDLKEKIFVPYSRGPEAAELPGSGIGLSLVARFAELHGGRAWVEDRPGKGASFRVFLPDAPSSMDQPGPAD